MLLAKPKLKFDGYSWSPITMQESCIFRNMLEVVFVLLLQKYGYQQLITKCDVCGLVIADMVGISCVLFRVLSSKRFTVLKRLAVVQNSVILFLYGLCRFVDYACDNMCNSWIFLFSRLSNVNCDVGLRLLTQRKMKTAVNY